MRTVILLLLALAVAAPPLSAQQSDPPPPPPDEETQGTQDLPPNVCPRDFRDGPLYGGDGLDYYGIPAQEIVHAWLSPPHDSFGRVQSGTQDVAVSGLRILADASDYNTCLRLTTILTGGERSAPAPQTLVYFAAGGFYFVSNWKRAQTLDNYTTSYGHVMVFDSAFNLRGTYAF